MKLQVGSKLTTFDNKKITIEEITILVLRDGRAKCMVKYSGEESDCVDLETFMAIMNVSIFLDLITIDARSSK